MEEFDLNNIWNREQERADQFFGNIAPEVEKMAQKKSGDIISKVLKNSKIEVLAGLALIIPLLSIYLNLKESERPSFWYLILFTVIILIIFVILVMDLHSGVKAINAMSVKEGIAAKIAILQSYINRMRLYNYVFLPVGFIAGFMSSFLGGGSTLSLTVLLVVLLIFLPVSLAFAWYINKRYIFWLYGRHLEELKSTYTRLSTDQ